MLFLGRIFKELEKNINPTIGGEFIAGSFAQFFDKPKTKHIDASLLKSHISNKDWFVLDKFAGTSEEEGLINFIKDEIGNLKDQYKEVHLLRNEEVYKIYDFDTGQGFQPDFILFLKQKEQDLYYQVFIEPKGSDRIEHDKWKQDFLLEITRKYSNNKTIIKIESKKYCLIGLPFFNQSNNECFKQNFRKITNNK